jgi:hypothetical protein
VEAESGTYVKLTQAGAGSVRLNHQGRDTLSRATKVRSERAEKRMATLGLEDTRAPGRRTAAHSDLFHRVRWQRAARAVRREETKRQ